MGEGFEDFGLPECVFLFFLAHVCHDDLFDDKRVISFDLFDEVRFAISPGAEELDSLVDLLFFLYFFVHIDRGLEHFSLVIKC
jgi:hypothetical protein